MSAYLVAQVQIEDRDEYSKYEAGFMEILQRFAGELLAVDDQAQVLEGQWPYTRTVVLRFADAGAAQRWYDSSDYQTLAQHRFRAASANIVLAQGLA